MLRTPEQRAWRAAGLRTQIAERERFEEETHQLLDLGEVAAELKVSRSTARRLLRNLPGVHLLRTPGCSRPMIRVEREVLEGLLRRSINR